MNVRDVLSHHDGDGDDGASHDTTSDLDEEEVQLLEKSLSIKRKAMVMDKHYEACRGNVSSGVPLSAEEVSGALCVPIEVLRNGSDASTSNLNDVDESFPENQRVHNPLATYEGKVETMTRRKRKAKSDHNSGEDDADEDVDAEDCNNDDSNDDDDVQNVADDREGLQEYSDFLRKLMQPGSMEFLESHDCKSRMEEVLKAREKVFKHKRRLQKGQSFIPSLPRVTMRAEELSEKKRLHYAVGLKRGSFWRASSSWLQYFLLCERFHHDPEAIELSVVNFLEYLASPMAHVRHRQAHLRVYGLARRSLERVCWDLNVAAKMHGYVPLETAAKDFVPRKYLRHMITKKVVTGEFRPVRIRTIPVTRWDLNIYFGQFLESQVKGNKVGDLYEIQLLTVLSLMANTGLRPTALLADEWRDYRGLHWRDVTFSWHPDICRPVLLYLLTGRQAIDPRAVTAPDKYMSADVTQIVAKWNDTKRAFERMESSVFDVAGKETLKKLFDADGFVQDEGKKLHFPFGTRADVAEVIRRQLEDSLKDHKRLLLMMFGHVDSSVFE